MPLALNYYFNLPVYRFSEMTLFQKFALFFSVTALTVTSTLAQATPLPDSGTYFIVNAASGDALQPSMASAGQNVFLKEFNKGGLQKWTLVRKVDPATKKPTNRYNIRLAGENAGLHFQPFPAPDHTAMISTDTSVFVLDSGEGGCLVKSVASNGDALYTYPYPPMDTEARFGPSDGSAKFRWNFIAVGD